MSAAEIGDIVRWTEGWGAVIYPPMWAVVIDAGTATNGRLWHHARIADRGGLPDTIAIHGEVSWSINSNEINADIEIVPQEEVPDHVWGKIAYVQLMSEGEKPC
jgi:hypothetical protein